MKQNTGNQRQTCYIGVIRVAIIKNFLTLKCNRWEDSQKKSNLNTRLKLLVCPMEHYQLQAHTTTILNSSVKCHFIFMTLSSGLRFFSSPSLLVPHLLEVKLFLPCCFEALLLTLSISEQPCAIPPVTICSSVVPNRPA